MQTPHLNGSDAWPQHNVEPRRVVCPELVFTVARDRSYQSHNFSSLMARLLIALKRGGMPPVRDIRFDPIPLYDLIQFRARIDVKSRFLSRRYL